MPTITVRWLAGESTGERLNLRGANLRGANFSGVNLSGANLSEADLSGADLSGASFIGGSLIGANLSEADLSGANFSGVNLSGANLSEASLSGADFSGANLSGANGLPIASDAPERLQEVARAVIGNPEALCMGQWHTCETTHCLAGWAIHQAGELGRLLEASAGPHMAGLQLLGVEAAEHFYDSDEDVLAWLEGIVK